ncbi:MAG: hypothetical protein A2516_10080 [Alphaproteobacteria bacterium RIFOXYD12_FULL_60_8]|nr:MAG: hypothetical protein A2516_10080 [Alphaproteobacteria bacterium RIFOXYD12_FULL_60_8]
MRLMEQAWIEQRRAALVRSKVALLRKRDICAALNLPATRYPEIIKGERKIQPEEASVLARILRLPFTDVARLAWGIEISEADVPPPEKSLVELAYPEALVRVAIESVMAAQRKLGKDYPPDIIAAAVLGFCRQAQKMGGEIPESERTAQVLEALVTALTPARGATQS